MRSPLYRCFRQLGRVYPLIMVQALSGRAPVFAVLSFKKTLGCLNHPLRCLPVPQLRALFFQGEVVQDRGDPVFKV